MSDLFRILVVLTIFIFYLDISYTESEFTTLQKLGNGDHSTSPGFKTLDQTTEINTLQSSTKDVSVSSENIPLSTTAKKIPNNKKHLVDENKIPFNHNTTAERPINSSRSPGKICNETLKFLPDAKNCSLYQSCHKMHTDSNSNHEYVTKSCSNGYLFDSVDAMCVPKSKAFCGVFNCTKPDGFFPDLKDSKYFITCYDSKPRRKRCEPLGTIFDKDLQICIRAPEVLPRGLKLFKLFLWFVVATEPQQNTRQNCHSIFKSTEDLAKIVAVAVFIPLMWLFTVVGFYLEIQSCRKSEDCDLFFDEEEEYTRYLPMSANITTPELRTRLELLTRTNISRCTSNSHLATTTF